MMEYNEIDWNEMWRFARKKRGSGKQRGPASWDRRADSFRRRTRDSVYIEKFIHLLNPQAKWSILDIGCGPGTLALPLSAMVQQVTAVDFSPRMLELLDEEATRRGIDNITTIQASWDDDWAARSIEVHDVVLASRSLAVDDLRTAIEKLCNFARQAVCITDRVAHGPLDPDAFAAVGRPMRLGPDYIYTVNLLYQMGIRARVDFITLDEPKVYASLEEATEGFLWMFREELNRGERVALQKYVASIARRVDESTWVIRPRRPPVWAFLSWRIEE